MVEEAAFAEANWKLKPIQGERYTSNYLSLLQVSVLPKLEGVKGVKRSDRPPRWA